MLASCWEQELGGLSAPRDRSQAPSQATDARSWVLDGAKHPAGSQASPGRGWRKRRREGRMEERLEPCPHPAPSQDPQGLLPGTL